MRQRSGSSEVVERHIMAILPLASYNSPDDMTRTHAAGSAAHRKEVIDEQRVTAEVENSAIGLR